MVKIFKRYSLIILVVLAVIFLFQKINWLPSFNNIFKSQPVTIEQTPVLIKEINTLSQLITITYSDEVVSDTARISSGLPMLVPTHIGKLITPSIDRLVIIGRGKVIAGTDLKSINESDLAITGDSIHITLPRAIILQTVINPSGYEIFTEEGNWPEYAVTRLKLRIKESIELNALAQNILGQADERSKNIIETFLKSTGFQKVSVAFR